MPTNLLISKILHSLQLYLIIILILTLPYKIASAFFIILSSIIFAISAYTQKIDIKELFSNKSILLLFLFIAFIYISIFWSPAENIFGGDAKVTIYGYLNYILLIPAIYFSKLTINQIHRLFLFMIATPFLYIFLYYTNFLDLTNIHYGRDHYINKHIFPDLFANLFILFGSIFVYIKLISNITLKNYQKVILYFSLFSLMSISLFIDKDANSRLISLAWLISIIFITFHLISLKFRWIIISTIMLLSIIFILNSNTFNKGLFEIKDAYVNKKFEGSWGHRLKLAEYGINIWLENPIIGRGIIDTNDKMREMRKVHPEDFHDSTVHFHNQHILILAQVGLVGYVLFLSSMYYLYILKIKDPEIYLFKQITVIAYLFLMLGEHYLQMIFTSTFFALCIALFLRYRRVEISNQN